MSDALAEDRENLLRQIEGWLETPMIVLSFIWLALVLVELVWGASQLLEIFGVGIWAIFVAEYALRLWLAPTKTRFLRSNVISLVALIVPAFRTLRLFRVARAVRGVRLVKVLGTVNRGMRALQASMGRRGLGYVLLLSLVVLLLGAAGMYALEDLGNYGDALWWTAMVLASMGTDFWPQSPEGRVLCFLLTLYGLGVFGYITASLASFFVGRDATHPDGLAAGADLMALRAEISALRVQLSRQ